MKHAYHGTSPKLLPRLEKYGLVPGAYSGRSEYSEHDDGRHLFFSDSLEYAKAFGNIVVRFPWPVDAVQDRNMYGRSLGHQFVSRSTVPPEKLTVVWCSTCD